MDMKSFAIVYQAHYQTVYHYLLTLSKNPALAEDLTQEAFLKFQNSHHRFRKECSELTMLCTIGKNLYLNHLRKTAPLHPLETSAIPNTASFEDALLEKDALMQLHHALHHLSEPYKEVFSLHIFGELTFANIASLFGKSESWAKMTFYRAKEKIRKEIGGNAYDI